MKKVTVRLEGEEEKIINDISGKLGLTETDAVKYCIRLTALAAKYPLPVIRQLINPDDLIQLVNTMLKNSPIFRELFKKYVIEKLRIEGV